MLNAGQYTPVDAGLIPTWEIRDVGEKKDEPWKLKYFGIGNGNWGCGGSVRPEFYADKPAEFKDAKIEGKGLIAVLPSKFGFPIKSRN